MEGSGDQPNGGEVPAEVMRRGDCEQCPNGDRAEWDYDDERGHYDRDGLSDAYGAGDVVAGHMAASDER